MRIVLSTLLLLLAGLLWSGAARAEGVELRSNLCHANAAADLPPSAATVRALSFECGSDKAVGYHDRWLWLRLDTVGAAGHEGRLAALPANWHLLVDQARFDQIAVIAIAADGSRQEIVRGARDLSENWAPGGLLRFGKLFLRASGESVWAHKPVWPSLRHEQLAHQDY